MHHLIAMGGIDIRGIQDTVAHTLHAATRCGQGIDTTEKCTLQLGLIHRLIGTHCHTVVLSEHEIDLSHITFS